MSTELQSPMTGAAPKPSTAPVVDAAGRECLDPGAAMSGLCSRPPSPVLPGDLEATIQRMEFELARLKAAIRGWPLCPRC